MSELVGKLSSSIPIEPKYLKTGAGGDEVEAQLELSSSSDSWLSKLSKIQLSYTRSFTSTPPSERTLLHLRDLLLSLVIGLSTRCVLTKNSSQSQLTTQGYHFYRLFRTKDCISHALFSNAKNIGNFGSISFLFYLTEVNLDYPITTYKSLMDIFWRTYHLPLTSQTNNSYPYDWVALSEELLTYLFGEVDSRIVAINNLVQPVSLEATKYAKRNLFVEEDYSYLVPRLLLSEHRKEFPAFLDHLESGLGSVVYKTVSLNKPYSTVGFYWGLVLQGLLNTVEYITNLDYEDKIINYNEFLSKGVFTESKKEIVNRLILSYDALYYLQWFNTIEEAGGLLEEIKTMIKSMSSTKEDINTQRIREVLV